MPIAVSFKEPLVAEVVDIERPSLEPDEVRIQTLFSGISAGTELTAYRGTNPYLDKRWDEEARLFVPGESTLQYPLVGWGYEEVGTVVEIGASVTTIEVGLTVWGSWGHCTEAVRKESYVAPRKLADGVDPRVGVFAHIGGIALNVVLDGDIHVGETVAVFGLGVPGQIAAQLARLNGASVIGVDGIARRRELAERLGAVATIDPAAEDVGLRIRDLTGGRGADVCLEVSGNYAALHEAIRSVAYSSRVCAAGFMQGEGAGLRLGEEFHHNRVQVIGSQISGVAPHLQHRWNELRLDTTVAELASTGRLNVLDLISHTFPLSRGPEAFGLLHNSPSDALQVVLDTQS